MSDLFAPYVLKMAATKRSALKGAARRKLDTLIDAARAADAAQMAVYADTANSAWCAAADHAQAALRVLNDYAQPIVPKDI